MFKPQRFTVVQSRVFNRLLILLELRIIKKRNFLLQYGEAYKLPKRIMQQNLTKYSRMLKAIEVLKSNEFYE